MSTMKYVSAALMTLTLAACNAPSEVALTTAAVPEGDAPTDPTPEPSPSPSPSTTSSPTKSLLSSWTSDGSPANSNAPFTVDFSVLVDLNAGAAIETSQSSGIRANFVFTASVTCAAYVEIDGTEDNGSLKIIDSRSTTGSASANNAYCDPIEGTYIYEAMAGGQIRIQKSGTWMLQ